ncbi:Ubiquitinyl hydrolase 1 [Handroanthus impetiginosus]|uniref:ubiquitinyl hydrolase 1 n=1 Tax=Handroanthus impetiginosus TaxID=429701 RepID=A0A2G9FX29_9LAMI|nr:Ubiquitinyl hydrolase 1 [Handroanthus impetiginosus]
MKWISGVGENNMIWSCLHLGPYTLDFTLSGQYMVAGGRKGQYTKASTFCYSFSMWELFISLIASYSYDVAEDDGINANEDIVSQLVSMGFQYLHCQKAAINTSNTGVEEAMNWLLNHMDDPANPY